MDESILNEFIQAIPENYIESVWEIEFTDLDGQIDHQVDFADHEHDFNFDPRAIRRYVTQLTNEQLDFEFFRANARALQAGIYRSFCVVDRDDRASIRQGISALELYRVLEW